MGKSVSKENIVIGGSGFIGSQLCSLLRKRGKGVLSISKAINPKMTGIAQEKCDVKDVGKLKKILRGGENIYVMIGQIHPKFNLKREIKNIKNILGALDRKTTRKLIYFSSVLIYGETKMAADELHPVNPIDDYGKYKVECEKMIMKRARHDNFFAGILRLANVYGKPGNRGLIGIVLDNLARNKNDKVFLNGDGKQTRDYIFIDDVINVAVGIADKLKKTDIVNIATGKSHSLIELIKKMSDITGINIEYEIKNDELAGIKNSFVSNKKLIAEYKLAPKFGLEKGLCAAWSNYKKYERI